MYEQDFLNELICPVCGKSFIPAPMHVYRDKRCRKRVCSWSCVCKSERLKGERKYNERKYNTYAGISRKQKTKKKG